MTATAAPATNTIPAWIKPGAPVVVFHGFQGIKLPTAIDQGVIESFTPFVVTLTGGAKFAMASLTEIGEDAPFQTRIADPASDSTILLTDRFNKKMAMQEFEASSARFKAAPSAESAQRVVNSLKAFI